VIRIQEFFDKATFTLTYVVWDPATLDAVVIDPILDYDPASSQVSEVSASKVITFIDTNRLKPHYILETHAHADHLSGSQIFKVRYPSAQIGIGAGIKEVQKVFKQYFDLHQSFRTDGSQFDRLFRDQELFSAGSLKFEVIYTPGHTPACCSYKVADSVFTGDALFMPDYGVGRCDFPAASAESLFQSVTQRLYSLPDATRVFTGHDYQPNGRPLRFESSIGEQKESNVQINAGTSKDAFVKFRNERDRTLAAPKLLLPSVQINIDAGRLPSAHANGKSYLSIPITRRN
jgi:glyoxylase-like metal-dependent hydrolase (beta-lactamase superfamily II)